MFISEFIVSNYIFVLINIILILIIIFIFILISIFKGKEKNKNVKISKSYDIDISGKHIYINDEKNNLEKNIDIKSVKINSDTFNINKKSFDSLIDEQENVNYIENEKTYIIDQDEKIIKKVINKKSKYELKLDLEKNIDEVGKILEKNNLSDNEVVRLLKIKDGGLDNLSDDELEKINILDTIMIENDISIDSFKEIIKEKKIKEEKNIKQQEEEIKNIGLTLKNNNFSNDEVKRLLELKKIGKGNISKDDIKRLDILEKIMIANNLPVDKFSKLIIEKDTLDKTKNKEIKNIFKSISNCNLSSDDISRSIQLKKQDFNNLSESDKEKIISLDTIIMDNNISMEYFTEVFKEKINIDNNINEKINSIAKSLEDNHLSNDEIVRLLILKKTGNENLSDDDRKKLEILDSIIGENKMSIGGFSEMIDLKIKKDEWVKNKSANVYNFIDNNVMSIDQINKLLDLKTSGYTKFSQDELSKLSEIEEFFDLNFLTQDGLNEILQKNKSIESSIIKNLDDEIYKFLEKLGVSGVDLLRLFQLREQKNINLHPKDKGKIEEIDIFVGDNSIDIESLKNIINTKYSKYLNDSNVNFSNLVKNNIVQNKKIDNYKTIDYKSKKYKTF